jgi:cell division protease FtsH
VRELACQSLERAVAILAPRRELMDQLVDRLIAEETIDGESFRQSVAAWETSHPELAVGHTLPAARLAVPVGET